MNETLIAEANNRRSGQTNGTNEPRRAKKFDIDGDTTTMKKETS
jgi:hypothetical protein